MPDLKKFNFGLRVYYRVMIIINPLMVLGLRIHSRLFKQQRVRVLLVNEYGRVLLVRHVFGALCWSLPGGGVNKGESPEQAAVRELQEELGVIIDQSILIASGTVTSADVPDLPYEAPLFYARITSDQIHTANMQRFEIKDIGWFAQDSLPDDITEIALRAVNRLPSDA